MLRLFLNLNPSSTLWFVSPTSWTLCRLRDCCVIQMGGLPQALGFRLELLSPRMRTSSTANGTSFYFSFVISFYFFSFLFYLYFWAIFYENLSLFSNPHLKIFLRSSLDSWIICHSYHVSFCLGCLDLSVAAPATWFLCLLTFEKNVKCWTNSTS